MILQFLTEDYKIKNICDDFISLTYSEDYCDSGEFTCVLPMTREVIPDVGDAVLCDERLVYTVESSERDTEKGTVTLSGKGILSHFGRKIITDQGHTIASCEEIIETLAANYGSSAFKKTLEFDSPASDTKMSVSYEEGNLLTAMKEIAGEERRGLSLTYDFNGEKFILSVTELKDRRLGGGDSPVFLSEGFDSLRDVSYSVDLSDYVNKITVRGVQKDDGGYYSVTVYAADQEFADGFDDSTEAYRETIIKNALATTYYTAESGLNESAYLSALRDRGRAALSRHRPRRVIGAHLPPETTKDLSVGDLCTIFTPVCDAEEVYVARKECKIIGGRAYFSAVLNI